MKVTFAIVKRNMLNYFYDKTSIFFSMLSVMILVLVYVFFLGQLQIDNIKDLVGEINGIDGLTLSWLVAGLVITSTVTVSMSTMSDIVLDRENKMFQDFYVAPIKRGSIVVAYIISSIMITILMAYLTFTLGSIYIGITSSIWIPFSGWMNMFLVIVLSSTLFASLSFVLLSFVKTASAAGTVNTLIGTLIGFFAGIYVPFGAFSQSFQNIIQLNPAAQIVVIMRQIMTRPYIGVVFDGAPQQAINDYESAYGIVLNVFGSELQVSWIILIGLGWITAFIALGLLRLRAYKE
ncbi:MAG: ABC transporter permease [Acholeplasmataceae bacterium]